MKKLVFILFLIIIAFAGCYEYVDIEQVKRLSYSKGYIDGYNDGEEELYWRYNEYSDEKLSYVRDYIEEASENAYFGYDEVNWCINDYFDGEYINPEDFNACLEYLYYFHKYFYEYHGFEIPYDMYSALSEKGKEFTDYYIHKEIVEEALIEE